MADASPICLMARASSTKSWLWHQRLSHLNFDTINDLARNDLVAGLSKFKYHKEHLCPSCEQGKSKRASHPPKPVPNSRQRLHLLHIDLCGPMRITSINEKRYILVIVDDYSHYTWVHFLRSKDEAPADSGFELTGFSDNDYAGCKDSFKSTSGGAQFLGEKLVSWSSKKQDCTTLSTAEAEYVSLSACCAQVLWMRTQLTDYGFDFTKIPIYLIRNQP
nr:uncharacterized mitochondrial protein AtMg00810-like [Tanacetum cinerariifolium]